jgi:putative membrane protein insertion efficiency factor
MLSPYIGWHCRFHPSCSAYAKEAFQTHGIWKGGWLTVKRILRCNPFGGSGVDEVPPVEKNTHE